MYVYFFLNVNIYTYIYIFIYIYIYTYICISMYVYIYICMKIYIFIHLHILFTHSWWKRSTFHLYFFRALLKFVILLVAGTKQVRGRKRQRDPFWVVQRGILHCYVSFDKELLVCMTLYTVYCKRERHLDHSACSLSSRALGSVHILVASTSDGEWLLRNNHFRVLVEMMIANHSPSFAGPRWNDGKWSDRKKESISENHSFFLIIRHHLRVLVEMKAND